MTVSAWAIVKQNRARVAIGAAVAIAAVAILAAVASAVLRFKRDFIDWPTHPLEPLVAPGSQALSDAHSTIIRAASESVKSTVMAALKDSPQSASLIGADPQQLLFAARGRPAAAPSPPIQVLRPFNPKNPSNYFGVVKITRARSATLHVESDGYFEIGVYTQPDWTPVFSRVGSAETPLDWLAKSGVGAGRGFAVVVFAASQDAKGHLEICANRNRPKPAESASPRRFDPDLAHSREEGIASTIDFIAPRGTSEILRIHAAPAFVWPAPVLTRVETVYAVIPDNAVAVYAVVPAFGFVVEGEKDHLAAVVHENNGAVVHRAVARPTSDGLRVVCLTAVYPNVAPETTSRGLTPKTSIYVYGVVSSSATPRIDVVED